MRPGLIFYEIFRLSGSLDKTAAPTPARGRGVGIRRGNAVPTDSDGADVGHQLAGPVSHGKAEGQGLVSRHIRGRKRGPGRVGICNRYRGPGGLGSDMG